MIYDNPARAVPHFSDRPAGIACSVIDVRDAALLEALRLIPEDADFPHELIELLAQQRAGRQKKTWLLTRDGTPIAVAPLRRLSAFAWQPVTQYILPGIVIPGLSETRDAALARLGLNLRIAHWRVDGPPPAGPTVHDLTTTTTYGMSCSDDFEAYWKSTDTWRNLRAARNKCQHLTLKENAPGASEWIIANWARKWGVPEGEMQDRILAAQFLEARGRHFSLTLFDGEQPVAGQTCLSHRGEMVGQCLYREGDNNQLNNRLIHLTFCWAKEKGFSAIDIGGGHDYKRKFAPARGERHEFTVAPIWRHRAEQGVRRLKERVRGLSGQSPDGAGRSSGKA